MEEELVVQEEIVPADRPPMNTREVFLNPPDWRYQQAATYLDDERAGKTPTIPVDPIVQLVIRALRAYRRVPNRLYMDALWNTTEEVIRLGTTMRQSAIVAEMEAHLIAGHKPNELKEWACHIPTKLYEMYGKIFFDLSGITAINSWIHDFLIEPERNNKNQMLLKARLLAYYKDAGSGAASAVMGLENNEGVALLKQIGSNERQKDLFDYMVKHTKIPQETYVMLMETALKNMTERDFQEHMKDREDAEGGSLESIAVGIEEGVRHYTSKEIAEVDEQGYDPTNQYTRVLTHKETADGE